MSDAVLNALRDVIQEDAAGRGLRTDPATNLVTACPDDFAAACRSLADAPAARVMVVTGFHIAHAEPPCAETDGPLGAVFLARALTPLGIDVVLAADGSAVPAMRAGLDLCGLLDAVPVVDLPQSALDESAYADWVLGAHDLPTAPLTHLIAVERVGPSHTLQSLRAQPGTTAEVLEEFQREVPPPARDRYHSMRARDLTAEMSPAHLLFERAAEREPPLTTIGIGDGGNEIGMGRVPWGVIRKNIAGGGRIACRTATDLLIVAGVSNWGAYALAAGVRLLRHAPLSSVFFDVEKERLLLERMVAAGPLVDGKTGQRAATVDGLPFERHAEVLLRLAALLPREGDA